MIFCHNVDTAQQKKEVLETKVTHLRWSGRPDNGLGCDAGRRGHGWDVRGVSGGSGDGVCGWGGDLEAPAGVINISTDSWCSVLSVFP